MNILNRTRQPANLLALSPGKQALGAAL